MIMVYSLKHMIQIADDLRIRNYGFFNISPIKNSTHALNAKAFQWIRVPRKLSGIVKSMIFHEVILKPASIRGA